MKGVNHHSMNENNKYLILRALSTLGACSRSRLCEYTGLSKMTISNLVNEYIDAGVVEGSGKMATVAGRKSEILRLIPDSLLVLGVLAEREYTEVGIVNLSGRVLRSERFEIFSGDTVEDFIETLVHQCSVFINSEWRDRIWGIGVAAMGPLDPKTGVIQEPPDFHGFKNIHIVEILYKSFGIPVYLELGAHVGALSELFYGNKKGYDNFLYISVDNWIGGCSVSGRTVYQGSNGLAGHMGGVVLERDAMDEKRCLSGCLQDYASITAITKWARENGAGPNITWNRIVTEARHGESFARKVIERLVWYLGTAFINAVALLDIQCVYISGPILQGEDFIIPALEETVNRLMFAPEVRRVDVLAAKYSNNNAQIIGAAPLVLERHFEEEVTL